MKTIGQLTILFIIIMAFGCRQDNKKVEERKLNIDTIAQRNIYDKFINRVRLQDRAYIKVLSLKTNDTFNLISGLDLNNGDLRLFVETTSFHDDSLNQRPAGYYYLENDTLIKKLLANFIVTYQHGDCCTPDGHLFIIKNDTQIFSTGILHGRQGSFQESLYGWTIPIDSNLIQETLRSFKHLDKLCEKKTSR